MCKNSGYHGTAEIMAWQIQWHGGYHGTVDKWHGRWHSIDQWHSNDKLIEPLTMFVFILTILSFYFTLTLTLSPSPAVGLAGESTGLHWSPYGIGGNRQDLIWKACLQRRAICLWNSCQAANVIVDEQTMRL